MKPVFKAKPQALTDPEILLSSHLTTAPTRRAATSSRIAVRISWSFLHAEHDRGVGLAAGRHLAASAPGRAGLSSVLAEKKEPRLRARGDRATGRTWRLAVPGSEMRRRRALAGLLACGHTEVYWLRLPDLDAEVSGSSCSVRSRSQWRHREGLTPSSLFSRPKAGTRAPVRMGLGWRPQSAAGSYHLLPRGAGLPLTTDAPTGAL